ncbi:MAG: hypothetical protein ACO1RT_09410 [Planctomycetaceae bacterium]
MNEETTTAENLDAAAVAGELASPRTPWHKRHRRRIAAATAVLALIAAGAWFMFSDDESGTSHVTPPPTAAEQFDSLFAELQKSEDAEVRIRDFQIDDAMLRKLTSVDRLTTIQVNVTTISEATASALAAMPALEQLHLRGAVITDEILGQIAKSPTIWLLNLSDADVSPEAIEHLGTMPALRQLRLGTHTGDNRHGRAVSTLTRLRSVHLIGVYVTDEVLQLLAKMPQLESLYLDDTAVTEAGWTWLFQNSPHLHVHINQKHHDRDPHIH